MSSILSFQDRAKSDILVTSKYRGMPVMEWSKQCSREVAPFFLPAPIPSIKGLNGGEKPHRHTPCLSMEKGEGRPTFYSNPVDNRAYVPQRYEEIHKKCPIDMARAPAREGVFSHLEYRSGGDMLDPFKYPGWNTGKLASIARAERANSPFGDTVPSYKDDDAAPPPPLPVLSAYAPLPAHMTRSPLERRPPGGSMAKAGLGERSIGTMTKTGEPRNVPNIDCVKRHNPHVNMSGYAGRKPPKGATTYEKYKDIFRRRSPSVSEFVPHQKARLTPGFAPQRSSSSFDVESIVASAAIDQVRARSCMEHHFYRRARSNSPSSFLCPADGGSMSGGDDS